MIVVPYLEKKKGGRKPLTEEKFRGGRKGVLVSFRGGSSRLLDGKNSTTAKPKIWSGGQVLKRFCRERGSLATASGDSHFAWGKGVV